MSMSSTVGAFWMNKELIKYYQCEQCTLIWCRNQCNATAYQSKEPSQVHLPDLSVQCGNSDQFLYQSLNFLWNKFFHPCRVKLYSHKKSIMNFLVESCNASKLGVKFMLTNNFR